MSSSTTKGASDSNTTSHNSGNFQQSQNSTSNYTPNNLSALRAGWDTAGNLLNEGNWAGLLGQGVNTLQNGSNTATGTTDAASAAATKYANGDYLNSNPANAPLTPIANGSEASINNPAFQQMVEQLGASLRPQIDGSFAADGRYGSGADANAFASALTNTAGQLGYQNFNQGQQNQLTAAQLLGQNATAAGQQQLTGAGLAPGLTQASLAPGTALTTAALGGPLTAQQIIAMGNPGGQTQTSTNMDGTSTQNGKSNTLGVMSSNTSGMNFGSLAAM